LIEHECTTYTNTQTVEGKAVQRIGIHTTNSIDKTSLCLNGTGIPTCGDASSLLGKLIIGFIQEMILAKIDKDCYVVETIPQIIIVYFNSLSTVPDKNFIFAGYDLYGTIKKQLIYKVQVKQRT